MIKRLKLFFSLLVLCIVNAQAADLRFSKVTLTLSEDDRVIVDAQLNYELNDVASEALENVFH